ncbi:hypothetical protein JCM30237_20190 [Halolamina litorea]|uniref:GAF domain-containing protein n=1 Tax=Halolamina litorea TaxID=1515593 RepID=A0ABD6BTD8_9EURY|nr:GAF domain-containing protein [Halolamina litorea]
MLLCVDADDAVRNATAETLRGAGFSVAEAASAADARERLGGDVDAVVTEQALPDGTGLELVQQVRETSPDTNCVLYTDVPVEEIDTAAFSDVVTEYLRKDAPAAESELLDLVEQAVAFGSQTAYPLPENEEARLTALERYATDPESLGDSFRRLTEIATETFGVDAAAIGLIDAHEQRFLSCSGVSLGPIDREDTICTYAILDSDVTVIEDVSEDPRFADNDGLDAAGIHFYASAPVETDAGEVIGTFCIYDDAAREFDERGRELLTMFAGETMDQLTLRRRLRDGGGEDV